MSKVSDLKVACGYVDKALPVVCMNCNNFTSTQDRKKGVFGGEYTVESEKRCAKYGFAVKKMAVCDDHVPAAK